MTEHRNAASKIFAIAVVLILAGVTASCSTFGGSNAKKEKKALATAVEAFNHDFRWEQFNSASAWINPQKKEQYWAAVDIFKGKIHLTDFQVRDLTYDEVSGTGTAILYFQYYRVDDPVLRTVTFSQKWHYSEKDQAWQLAKSGYENLTRQGQGL